MGGFIVTLGGQNLTAFVDPLTLDLESALGQGPGVIGGTSGRATTCSFLTSLGPAASALGAGSPLPVRNLLTANQSSVEGGVTGFTIANPGTTLTQDGTQFWQGAYSLKCVADGTSQYQGMLIKLDASQLAPSTQYTFSAYVYVPAGSNPFLIQAQLGASPWTNYVSNTFTGTASWQRVVGTFTTPAMPPAAGFQLSIVTSGVARTDTFYVDGLQLETGSSASTWGVGGNPPLLLRQAEIVIYDTTTGNRMFGGYVTALHDQTMRKQPMVQVDCHDYFQDLDRVQVNLVFDGVADTAIINTVISTYAPWISLSQVNLAVSNYTFQLRRFRAKSVMQILQSIADVTGFDVWVDAYKQLHYIAPTATGTAAFAISDSPDGVTSFGAVFSKYDQDDTAIVNRGFFYGGKKPSTDFTQNLSNQCTGTNTLFTVAYYPRNSSDGKVHIKKNGTDLAVGAAFGTGAANTLKSQGGSADCILDVDAQTILFDSAPLATDTITAIYRYNIPLLVQLTNPQSYAFFGRYYDGNLIDDQVFDTQTAIQRLRILLTEQAYGLTEITFTTRQPGLQAGTQIRIDNSARGIHNTFMIQKVTTKPIGGGYYDFEVDCGAWNWQVADVLLAASRYLAPQDDSTDESTTPIQAQEVTTNMGVHFTVNTTSHFTGWFYARSMAVGDTHDAYCGFCTVATGALPTESNNEGTAGFGGGMGGHGNVIATGTVH